MAMFVMSYFRGVHPPSPQIPISFLSVVTNLFFFCIEARKRTEEIATYLEANLVKGEGTKQLLELYKKLQGRFDVFLAGRQLIKLGPLDKQSRKVIQPRFLLLVRTSFRVVAR